LGKSEQFYLHALFIVFGTLYGTFDLRYNKKHEGKFLNRGVDFW